MGPFLETVICIYMPSCRLISIFTGRVVVAHGQCDIQTLVTPHTHPLQLPPCLSPVPDALLFGPALNDLLVQWIKVEVPF